MKYFLLFFFFCQTILPQDLSSPKFIKDFADYLYCSKDFLRAVDEYNKYNLIQKDDTISIKIANCYLQMNQLESAESSLLLIKNSHLNNFINQLIFKIKFLNEDYDFFSSKNRNRFLNNNSFNRFILFSSIKNNSLIGYESVLEFFNDNERSELKEFIDERFNSNYKNQFLAGVLSTLIPGSGKIYTQFYEDGITSFLVVGLLSFLSYDNFKSDHKFRGWLFAGISSFFYLSNIYGSIASVNIFNAKIDSDFNLRFNNYLEEKNYFIKNEIELECK